MSFKVSNDFLDAFHRIGAKDGHDYGEPPAKKLSLLLRPAFIAPKGKTLVWGDWSNIEARVLPWLAASRGAEDKLDIFRAVDADKSQPDVYIRTAADLLELDAAELWADFRDEEAAGHAYAKQVRQSHGKVPELALGFGGGLGALQAMATAYGVYLEEVKAKEMIDRWRSANAWARTFWGGHGREGSFGIWGAVNSALESPETVFAAGRVAYVFDPNYLGGTLFCALPCGRLLTYPAIKWGWREVEDKKTGKLVDRYQLSYLKGYARTGAWYGKFCVDGDALVATDNGWKPLRTVNSYDRVFDGVEFVRHEGLIFQGVKSTVSVDGVRMTPDHEVLTGAGWRQAQDCSGLHRAGFREPYGSGTWAAAAARQTSTLALSVRLRGLVRMLVGGVGEVEPETVATILRLRNSVAHWRGQRDAWRVAVEAVRGLAFDAGSVPASVASGLGSVRRSRHQGLRTLAALREFFSRYGAFLPGGPDAGTRGRERRLRAGELYMGDAARAGVEQAKFSAPEHGGSFSSGRDTALNVALSLAPRPVYDLVNAGPRRRFMVLGERGPFIVHNCENITQAAAASVLRRTLKRLDREWAKTDAGGFARYNEFMPVVMHTHDEVVTEVPEWAEHQAGRALHEVMVTNDGWDEGLPLAAEISSGWFYTKNAKEMEL